MPISGLELCEDLSIRGHPVLSVIMALGDLSAVTRAIDTGGN